MPENFENRHLDDGKLEFTEPHDEVWEKYHRMIKGHYNNWYMNCPGGKRTTEDGEQQNRPLGEIHRDLAKEEADRTKGDLKEITQSYNKGFSEKKLAMSEVEIHKMIEDKCREVGVDPDKIKRMNTRLNEIYDNLQGATREQMHEMEDLRNEINRKMAVVFREMIRQGFNSRDLSA